MKAGDIGVVYFETAAFEHQPAALFAGIAPEHADAADAGVGNHAGADRAGKIGDVDFRAVNRYAVARGLQNRVLFGVQAVAEFEPFPGFNALDVALAAAEFAGMGMPGGRTVVAGAENLVVAHDKAADLAPQADAALRDQVYDAVKILVPGNAVGHGEPFYDAGGGAGEWSNCAANPEMNAICDGVSAWEPA